MLTVLDNAGSADQVRSLLPGNLGLCHRGEQRDALAALMARDGAARPGPDVLPPEDGCADRDIGRRRTGGGRQAGRPGEARRYRCLDAEL